jgi:hypothetical protein
MSERNHGTIRDLILGRHDRVSVGDLEHLRDSLAVAEATLALRSMAIDAAYKTAAKERANRSDETDRCAVLEGRLAAAERQVESQAREIERLKGRLAWALEEADAERAVSASLAGIGYRQSGRVWSRRRSGGGTR